MVEKPIYPIICGPTASGKSSLALGLAEKFPIEIISADSRQIIKHLDIGTAKPSKLEQEKVPVHLINLVEPGERYSAVRFAEATDQVITQIVARKHIPVIVGGTGLYLKALIEGLIVIDKEVADVRKKLEDETQKLGPVKLHEKLARIDPEEAARIHPNNIRRVQRALEIFYQTGQIKSELIANGSYKKSVNSFEYFCITPPREELYEKINKRVDLMLKAGWLEELKELIKAGFKENIRKAEVIGYAELLEYLDNQTTLDKAVEMIKQNTRRFAKRQMTWYRGLNLSHYYLKKEECLSALCEFIAKQKIV